MTQRVSGAQANALIRQAFTLYGDRITTLHLKDCVFEGEDQKYRHPGEGIFCYEELMRQVAQWKPYIIGTLENSSPDRYAADCAFTKNCGIFPEMRT